MAHVHLVYTELPPSAVSDAELKGHAQLFSNHYGTWAQNPHGLKAGDRVRTSASRLRAEHLFDEQSCSFIRATAVDEATELMVGHACVCRFDVPGKVGVLGRHGDTTGLVSFQADPGRGFSAVSRVCASVLAAIFCLQHPRATAKTSLLHNWGSVCQPGSWALRTPHCGLKLNLTSSPEGSWHTF
jgi:hypothetical protein